MMPQFITDPIVIDAAGQIVGFWTKEYLEKGFVVFPFRLKELHIFGPRQPLNRKIWCKAQIQIMSTQRVCSDFDILDDNGRLWMRLEAWEDRRFELPSKAYSFLLSPSKVMLSTRWESPGSSFSNLLSFSCFRFESLSLFDEAFWRQVFAHLVLNAREREAFRILGKSKKRLTQWLAGRLAAKDALRALLKQHYDMELGPADVEIEQDERGRPVLQGAWAKKIDSVPALSLAHTNGMAVAIAGLVGSGKRIGIDVEHVRSLEEGFMTAAFTSEELNLLNLMIASEHREWVIRFWCAKEALAKALGRGLTHGPQSLVVQEMNNQTGDVKITLQGSLAKDFPEISRSAAVVHTALEQEYVIACTVC